MSKDRFFIPANRVIDSSIPGTQLQGFATNPLAGSVTPAQALMYQAAFLQAQKDLQEPEWPLAESWN